MKNIIEWFHDQKDYWINMILSHNNPMYLPMIIGITKKGESFCTELSGMTLVEKGKQTVLILKKIIEKKGDAINGIIYYFHVDINDDSEKDTKETILVFNLFVPDKKDVMVSEQFLVSFYENEDLKDDMVEMTPLPDNNGTIESLKELWSNPICGL